MESTAQQGKGKVMFPRRHYFEVNDQPWFPQYLREKVQDYLTLGWINRFPIIQTTSPAVLVSRVLSSVLGPRVSDYVYVDFASGAGGPTPYIESHLNKELRDAGERVKFVLTDISPHVSAWEAIAKKSANISYIAQSVDATNAPTAETLLRDVSGGINKKVMRLFSLAFHHFDDDLAAQVLENTIETSDGFCIFELQSRHFSSFVLVSLLWPLAMLITPFYFLHSPGHLFFTYLVPIVPFIWVYDGYISCLRTRTPDEVQSLLLSRVSTEKLTGWKFKSGQTCHTWPIGWLNWIICYRGD
ncbi:uncharacterized protein Z518_08634 [Rhinocladiella mackenziei CBS 650.93]|uniref:Methyltransferase domain-containing protein n=1 Tax=Rhinocladiella mackenziei CBS 650.93 TaxID=1442369 RepID=A0A0D2FL53_9EURO|nr:uncharacterized protein Z518_08634 [Rhinocladiella mackenziei CBS 650.93]KIX02692.1 hypothetical protein Z518_08634 [Rhinocladiella mackenziei CBS 650.93]